VINKPTQQDLIAMWNFFYKLEGILKDDNASVITRYFQIKELFPTIQNWRKVMSTAEGVNEVSDLLDQVNERGELKDLTTVVS
jgi:hypothetical protein